MNIKLDANHYNYSIIVEAENVKVEESISETIYGVDADGKKNFKDRICTDIVTKDLEGFCILLDDIIYYRKADFDSSNLIENLFGKLPQNIAEELAAKLAKQYESEIAD